MAIEAQNGDYDLYGGGTTPAPIFSKTAEADHDLSLEIRFGDGIKNLNAGVGTITIVISNDGGTQEEVFYKGTQTRPIVPISKMRVASGKTITITAQSSNSADTDVNVTVTPRWELKASSAGAVDLTAASQTSLVAALEAEIADDATGEAVKQAIVAKLIENLPDLDDLTLAAIADAVCDELLADHASAGTLGKALADILIDTDSTLPAAIAAAAFDPATAQADTGVSWKGLFIKAAEGNEVKSVAGGRVVFADWMRGFGNLIIVDHGSGYMSLYGNNQALIKGVGEHVNGGDTIAAVGNSGGNETNGLYYELRRNSVPLDPLSWSRLR